MRSRCGGLCGEGSDRLIQGIVANIGAEELSEPTASNAQDSLVGTVTRSGALESVCSANQSLDNLEAPRIPKRFLKSELLEEQSAPADQDEGVGRSQTGLLGLILNSGDEARDMRLGVGCREDGDKAQFHSLSRLGVDVERVCVEEEIENIGYLFERTFYVEWSEK